MSPVPMSPVPMSPVLWAIMIVGALAVISFVGFLVVGLTRGWAERPAPLLLRLAAGLGIVCGVLGVILAVTSP